jgi:hypothetical protein
MANFKDTSNYYGDYLNQFGGYLGQNQVNTGRSATPDMTYGATTGALRPLLAYDLQRRQNQVDAALKWQAMHDTRKSQPSGLESMMKMGMGALSMLSSAYGNYQQGNAYGSMAKMAKGGIIDEPVLGRGMNTGREYLLGEEGPEQVTPMTSNSSTDFWSLFQKKKQQVEDEQQQQQQSQQQGGQSQMSPQQMLSIAQETPLNEYLGPLAKSSTGAGMGTTVSPMAAEIGAGEAAAWGYPAAEGAGVLAGAGEAGALAGGETAGVLGGTGAAAGGGASMGGAAGGAGGAAGGIGGAGMAGIVGAIIAAVSALQNAASNNTSTRIDPGTLKQVTKSDPDYYKGVKSGSLFNKHVGTEPWLAWLHDKFNLEPTAGEVFDAKMDGNRNFKGYMKEFGSDEYVNAADYWANPPKTWALTLGKAVLGEKLGKKGKWFIDPVGEGVQKLLKKIM